MAFTSTQAQSFTLQGLVHLYQSEIKARRKKGAESMAYFGWDVAKLVRLVYSSVYGSTWEVIGVNVL